jgi:hypothetical protein
MSARKQINEKVCPALSPKDSNQFLAIAKMYIRYEKELYADNLNKSRKE